MAPHVHLSSTYLLVSSSTDLPSRSLLDSDYAPILLVAVVFFFLLILWIVSILNNLLCAERDIDITWDIELAESDDAFESYYGEGLRDNDSDDDSDDEDEYEAPPLYEYSLSPPNYDDVLEESRRWATRLSL